MLDLIAELYAIVEGTSYEAFTDTEAFQDAVGHALTAAGPDGLAHPASTSAFAPFGEDATGTSWFERYARSFGGTIAGGTSEIQRGIIAQRVLGLPRA